MDHDDLSALESHMDCISVDLDGDAVSMDDEEHGTHGSVAGTDDRDDTPEDEQVCTYSKTSNTFSEQHWCVVYHMV